MVVTAGDPLLPSAAQKSESPVWNINRSFQTALVSLEKQNRDSGGALQGGSLVLRARHLTFSWLLEFTA
jgi:hypothetical protein